MVITRGLAALDIQETKSDRHWFWLVGEAAMVSHYGHIAMAQCPGNLISSVEELHRECMEPLATAQG